MKGVMCCMKDVILNIIKKKSVSFDLLLMLTELEKDELISILDELTNEGVIFLNSVAKYQFKSESLFVGTLERNSKGMSYVMINGEKIIIAPEELHTALKYDTVVVEILYEKRGSVKGIIERKNNRLVCEVKEYKNKLILVPFNGNCELRLIASQDMLKDLIIGIRRSLRINWSNWIYWHYLKKIKKQL